MLDLTIGYLSLGKQPEQEKFVRGANMAQGTTELFKKIVASGGEVNLFNVYKGVPLSFPARVIAVDNGNVRVQTDRYQTVCMYIEKKTFLQSQDLPDVLQAEVIDLDSQTRAATLTNFHTAERGIGSRMKVRIQPKDLLEGNIHNQLADNIIRGELADISQDGIAIYLSKEIFPVRQYYVGLQIELTLQLPGEYTINQQPRRAPSQTQSLEDRNAQENVRFSAVSRRDRDTTESLLGADHSRFISNPNLVIQAEIVNLRLDEIYSRYRVGMRILPGDPHRALIAQFIAQRQSEIIREIRVMYDLMLKISEK
jgi:hypothetical protein